MLSQYAPQMAVSLALSSVLSKTLIMSCFFTNFRQVSFLDILKFVYPKSFVDFQRYQICY